MIPGAASNLEHVAIAVPRNGRISIDDWEQSAIPLTPDTILTPFLFSNILAHVL
jgi:hypothetical protein